MRQIAVLQHVIEPLLDLRQLRRQLRRNLDQRAERLGVLEQLQQGGDVALRNVALLGQRLLAEQRRFCFLDLLEQILARQRPPC